MSRRGRGKRGSRPEPAAAQPSPLTVNWPLLALSLVGSALGGYLAWTAWSGGAVQGCAAGGGCDAVLSSRWATLLGLPTAFWGALAYLALARAAFLAPADRQWRRAWTISFFGVLYSGYLTTISLTVLGAACPYCLASLALMTLIFVLVTLQRPATLPGFSWPRWVSRRGLAAVGIIAFLHLNYTGVVGRLPAEEDPALRALAIHLADSGARMYGASWCPHCQEQKALFGGAERRLPYIECSSGPQGTPQTAACRYARISTYPTWEIDGVRYEEVLTVQRLAELTGFDLSAAEASNAAR